MTYIWTTWDDTAFVNEEALAAMEDEASGQQYTPMVQDLNNKDDDVVEDVVNEQDKPDANSKSKTK